MGTWKVLAVPAVLAAALALAAPLAAAPLAAAPLAAAPEDGAEAAENRLEVIYYYLPG